MNQLFICVCIFALFRNLVAHPLDVEVITGEEFHQPWNDDGDEAVLEAQSVHKTGFLKTYRNKRSTRYHVLPSEGLRSHFENVDLNQDDDEFISDGDMWKTIKRSAGPEKNDDIDVSTSYMEKLAIAHLSPRKKRDVIEEEKYYDAKTGKKFSAEDINIPSVTEKIWFPRTVTENDDIETLTTKNSQTNVEVSSTLDPPPNAQALHDRRGARGAQDQEQWIKIPLPDSQTSDHHTGHQIDQVSAPSSALISNEDMTARMPRVNFITQNKRLEVSETRNDGDSIPRAAVSRAKDTTAYFNLPEYNDRTRSMDPRFYVRQPLYYPDDLDRRDYADDGYYEDMSRIGTDDFYTPREPYPYYDDRRYSRAYDRGGRDRLNNYDFYDRSGPTKNRRVIYYTNLPEIARTPPNVDLRYKYNTPNTHKGYDDDGYRGGRFGGYYRGRYYRQPTEVPKKPEVTVRPRDSTVASSVTGDKVANDNTRKDQPATHRDDANRRFRDGNLNSHQYPINLSTGVNVNENVPAHRGMFQDVARVAPDYHRYDHPSFAAPIDDHFVNRRD